MHVHIYMFINIYRAGKYVVLHRQMQITFGVNANHFCKVIREIFWAL